MIEAENSHSSSEINATPLSSLDDGRQWDD